MPAGDRPCPFWLVWSPTGQRPPRYQHPTYGSAQVEADRLARENPGCQFYVLQPVDSRVVRGLTRETFFIEDDQVPF
jgi:hypothetical protein